MGSREGNADGHPTLARPLPRRLFVNSLAMHLAATHIAAMHLVAGEGAELMYPVIYRGQVVGSAIDRWDDDGSAVLVLSYFDPEFPWRLPEGCTIGVSWNGAAPELAIVTIADP